MKVHRILLLLIAATVTLGCPGGGQLPPPTLTEAVLPELSLGHAVCTDIDRSCFDPCANRRSRVCGHVPEQNLDACLERVLELCSEECGVCRPPDPPPEPECGPCVVKVVEERKSCTFRTITRINGKPTPPVTYTRSVDCGFDEETVLVTESDFPNLHVETEIAVVSCGRCIELLLEVQTCTDPQSGESFERPCPRIPSIP